MRGLFMGYEYNRDEMSLSDDNLSNKLKMSDFCDMQAFDRLIKDWSVCTGLAATAIGSNGKYISGYYNFTDFCEKLVRKSPEGLRRCTECDKKGWGMYVCHAGLVDFAAPITLEDGLVLGNMLGGQVLPQSPDEGKYRERAKELGIDEEAYIDALRKVNVRTEEEIKAAARLLATIVNSFVRSSYMAKQNAKTLMVRADIIASLSKLFFCDYYIDIENDHFMELDATEELHAFTGQSGTASIALKQGCSIFAQPDFRESFETFVDLRTLPDRVAQRQSISYEFISSSLGWCRSTFIVTQRNVSGIVTHVIYGVQSVQEEKEKEFQMLQTLKQTTEEAVRANRVKSDFLARMSHDMRTPLTTIMGLSDLAAVRYHDSKVLQDFRTIKNSSEYLLNLVSDVLDMQKLSSGTVTLRPAVCSHVETADLIKAIISAAAKAKNIHFLTEFHWPETKGYFKTDTNRVRQIIINLLNNAVKYTQQGGKVKWTIQAGLQTKDTVQIVHTISDNGPGMSADFLKVMYEPFMQAKEHRDGKGHGLGLAIVKKLVDLMGASITCRSVVGKGTTFTVTIPCAIANEQEVKAYRQSLQSTVIEGVYNNCHILVCEDNPVNAGIIREILRLKNIMTDHAEDGNEAVQLAKENSYDVILMDIMMPGLNGYQAASEIRKFNQTVPIIALSANSFPDDIEKSLASGMNAHISKPVNIKKMFAVIQQVMAKSQK
jgi:signal transduction histidine kinase/CheY-like chemotaxis protein